MNKVNIYTFAYQKTLLHTLFCLFFKPLKAFSGSLKKIDEKVKHDRGPATLKQNLTVVKENLGQLDDDFKLLTEVHQQHNKLLSAEEQYADNQWF